MRYYTVIQDGREQVAASKDGQELYILNDFEDMNQLIEAGGIREIPTGAEQVSADAKIISPIPRTKQDMLCLGINYSDHAVEAGRFSKEAFGGERPVPIFFSKRVNYSQGPDDIIPAYEGLVDSLDYECELAVIISKDAKDVKSSDAQDYVFGYTVTNDVSARNLQTSHKQWYFGKSLDGFAPMGPCIVSADEFAFPPALNITCKVNGELRQDSNTANLITSIPVIIETLTRGMTLKAGTVIATGTPSGVGMGMQPPVFLKKGDVVECSIEGIGTLKETVE
ncbi:MAG: fumarylacetoacetate hydrolase family protein [Eubacteriales bacterium]|nr:fumarylacetoacetate hydrolase family protein [Eubacteriales bacterium]